MSKLLGITCWSLADVVLTYIGERVAVTPLAAFQQWDARTRASHNFVWHERLKDRSTQRMRVVTDNRHLFRSIEIKVQGVQRARKPERIARHCVPEQLQDTLRRVAIVLPIRQCREPQQDIRRDRVS